MSYAGDAAEQVVRMSLETGEVAVRLAGSGAKQVAVMLYAILRDQEKSRGKTRLSQMLRSGKELKVFAVRNADLKRFCVEAKKYGVLYCVLKERNARDGLTDILVRAEDASKINRIFERFDLASVDTADVKSETAHSREAPQGDALEAPAEQMTEQEVDDFLDAMFSPAPEGEAPAQLHTAPERGEGEFSSADAFLSAALSDSPAGEESQTENPTEGRGEKSRRSVPTSKPKERTAQDISDLPERSSVRQKVNGIKAEQGQKPADREKSSQEKPAQHEVPPKKKSKEAKER